jgi:hypothetical protein
MTLAGLDRDMRAGGTVPRGVARVGLIAGVTGIPLFVLFLRNVAAAFHCELGSLEKVEAMRDQSGGGDDGSGWGHIEAFFQAGGTRAHVLALPIPAAGEGRLEAMIGRDLGVARRTGIQAVRDWAEKVDLLSIPQACELLPTKQYLGFCQSVLDMTCNELGILFLVDLPKNFDVEAAETFISPLFCPDAATFYPWLLVANRPVPPSVVMAAWMQRADAEVGVQEIAGQMALGAQAVPMQAVSPNMRRRLLAGRINTFLSHGGETLIWGGYTLADRADWRARLIPLRRSSLKLQQAVEQICEPYVLEPAGEELSVWVENSLQNFLRSVRRLFHRDLPEPYTTSVKVVSQDGEERIQVALNYALPHSIERFSLSFVA